ncbi:carboxypeptidase-like regulatory domain-containing protein [Flavobacterium sp. AC]|uniref:Carboxypeptidase-like regulatory domain-containing protein n=1 Tax=Flavobacterium azizsancarii TaxID=2961580 RepID=A0ABT4WE45_9FLAO|nr:carboxypeptidase-like regulatory domain-containing protein [Flavobacterium azizsancarii]MDA6070736.1 carboxypeptidase-like regulatory domain-containing protein [Flavobacterium azizsancarii]
MIDKVLCVLIFFMSQAGWSQSEDRTMINGQITSNASYLAGVYVINAQTEVMTATDDLGGFSIAAKPGETLVFSSIQFKENKVLLTPENFSDINFTVKLGMVMHQLQEVVIKNYSGINAVSLGIIPSGQKSYTEAERKLRTATDLDAHVGLGGSASMDPLLNMFSGRTAMLKKEVAVEKKEFFMKLLERMFTLEHFIDRLQIPLEYVKGFEYYAVDNDKFTAILNSKNKTSTEFLLAELAVKYKEIIARENK